MNSDGDVNPHNKFHQRESHRAHNKDKDEDKGQRQQHNYNDDNNNNHDNDEDNNNDDNKDDNQRLKKNQINFYQHSLFFRNGLSSRSFFSRQNDYVPFYVKQSYLSYRTTALLSIETLIR